MQSSRNAHLYRHGSKRRECGYEGEQHALMSKMSPLTLVKRTYYLVMTGRYTDIQKVLKSFSNTPNVTQYLDTSMIEICYEILCFHLEAVIYLEQWPDVEVFVRTASTIDSDHVRSIMVDMILTAEKMPLEYIIRSLQVSLLLLNQGEKRETQLTSYSRSFSIPFNALTLNVSALSDASSTYAYSTDGTTHVSAKQSSIKPCALPRTLHPPKTTIRTMNWSISAQNHSIMPSICI